MAQNPTTNSAQIAAEWRPKSRSGYLFFTLLSRGFFTITIAIFTSFGANSLTAYGFAVLTGIALDALRHALAPDLKTNPAQMREDIKSAITCRPQGIRPLALTGLMYAFVILYIVTIIILEAIVSSSRMQQYFDLFAPLTRAFSEVVPVIERHPMDLRTAGYLSRVAITEHLYTASILFLITSVWANSLLAKRYLMFGAVDSPALTPPFRQKIIKIIFVMYFVGLGFYLYEMLESSIGFGSPGPYSRSIHISSAHFMFLPFWIFSVSFFLSSPCLIIARLRNTAFPLISQSIRS